MNGDKSIAVVVGAGEKRFDFQLIHFNAQTAELSRKVVGHLFTLVRQLQQGFQVAQVALQLLFGSEHSIQMLAPLQEPLGVLRIVPDIGLVDFSVKLGELGTQVGRVKDSSAILGREPGCAQTAVPVLPSSASLPPSTAVIQNLRASAATTTKVHRAANQSP